jgi:hypothetical protein
MAKNIEESQQQSQGITIGNQGNEDMITPEGTKSGHQQKEGTDDRHIPNQEKSSAANQQKSGNSSIENQ